MKRNMFAIPGRLPDYNDQADADRAGKIAGARLRKETEYAIKYCIIGARNRGNVRKVASPCRIHFVWREMQQNRDLDNIFFAKKYVLDALQVAGILPNDSQKWVIGFTDTFAKCESKSDECVTIEIEEVQDGKENE